MASCAPCPIARHRQPWEEGFADGLLGSAVFVPILSKMALAPFEVLTPSSHCDNVLLEHRMALELKERKPQERLILPLLCGELKDEPHLGGECYGDFFRNGCMPNSPDVVVDAVESKLAEHLHRVGEGAPQTPPQSVKAVLSGVTSHQGVFLRGPRADALDHAVREIARAARSLDGSTGDSSSSHMISLRELSLSRLGIGSSSASLILPAENTDGQGSVGEMLSNTFDAATPLAAHQLSAATETTWAWGGSATRLDA